MSNKTCLLSICIPTFNRAEQLFLTINSIVCQNGFKEKCQLVVSDNASTDETESIMLSFCQNFPNIIYNRNKENIGPDRNLIKVISLASGEYVELLGDKILMLEGALAKILSYLEGEKISIISLLNGYGLFKDHTVQVCYTFNDYISLVSYFSTWLAGIIFSRDEFELIKNKEEGSGTNLIQTHWLFDIAARGNKKLISNEVILQELVIGKKSGYNLFKVFINNYLSLLSKHLLSGVLNKNIYKKQKKDLFIRFVIPWYISTKIMGRDNFDLSNANKVIFTAYYREKYFYFAGAYVVIRLLRRCTGQILAALSKFFGNK